jgi:ATP-dependent RNA helicase DDX1
VYESLKEMESAKIKANSPMCVILEPTKELAQQTDNEIERFKKYLDSPKIRCVHCECLSLLIEWFSNCRNALIVGGINIKDQLRSIDGGVDIITCTPGRIREMVSNGDIRLDQVRFFVLDEAVSF